MGYWIGWWDGHDGRMLFIPNSYHFLGGVVDVEHPRGGHDSSTLQQLRLLEELQRQASMKVQLSELELQLQASLASTYNGSFIWRMPDVTRRRRDAIDGRVTSIYSPPFYTDGRYDA